MAEISKRDHKTRLGQLTSAIGFVGVCCGWTSDGPVLDCLYLQLQ